MSTVNEWEKVMQTEESVLERLEVPGGWIYRETAWSLSDDLRRPSVALCFVPEGRVNR